jgi:hypothetical protein
VTEIREEIEASTARFISELGDVSEAQRHACKRAAERVALADALRRRALSGAEIDIADLVKLEDMADAAVAALRLPATGPKVQALQVTFVDPRTNHLPDGELQRLQDLLRKIEEGADGEAAIMAHQRAEVEALRSEIRSLQAQVESGACEIECLKATCASGEQIPHPEPRQSQGETSGKSSSNVVPLSRGHVRYLRDTPPV